MGKRDRLKRLEAKIIPSSVLPEHLFDIDQCIVHLGLDLAAVRESARITGSSLAVAISVMLGIGPREFARLIKEKANLVR